MPMRYLVIVANSLENPVHDAMITSNDITVNIMDKIIPPLIPGLLIRIPIVARAWYMNMRPNMN